MEDVALALFVSTERLGPQHGIAARRLGLSRSADEDQPTATCHLQVKDEENALCGYEWEGLTRVPNDPTWTDLHPALRCDTCSAVAGIQEEDPEGRTYRFFL